MMYIYIIYTCITKHTQAQHLLYSDFSQHSAGARFEYTAYGYNVGCNNLGEYPFPTEPVSLGVGEEAKRKRRSEMSGLINIEK